MEVFDPAYRPVGSREPTRPGSREDTVPIVLPGGLRDAVHLQDSPPTARERVRAAAARAHRNPRVVAARTSASRRWLTPAALLAGAAACLGLGFAGGSLLGHDESGDRSVPMVMMSDRADATLAHRHGGHDGGH